MEIEVTLQEITDTLANMYIKEISIPDLINNPYVVALIDLKNQQYYFEFYWNIRQQRCYLSLFRLQDGVREYYIKNRMLLNNINLSKYITKEDWEGLLYLESITGNYQDDYTINDIGDKFVLRYYTSK